MSVRVEVWCECACGCGEIVQSAVGVGAPDLVDVDAEEQFTTASSVGAVR